MLRYDFLSTLFIVKSCLLSAEINRFLFRKAELNEEIEEVERAKEEGEMRPRSPRSQSSIKSDSDDKEYDDYDDNDLEASGRRRRGGGDGVSYEEFTM